MSDSARLAYPFRGRWRALNSPADRVPSHGTHLLATTYAVDFVAVDQRGTTGPSDWRSALASEPPERFVGWDAPILAPLAATVVTAHDGEPDHGSRRSIFAGLPYLLTQGARMRGGAGAIAGNHVILAVGSPDGDHPAARGPFVLVAHLRRGSIRVGPGDRVRRGDPLGTCGNSGNSTQPHVHVQAMDGADPTRARGIPILFVVGDVDAADGGADPGRMPRTGEIVSA